jgi:hypothetical protein
MKIYLLTSDNHRDSLDLQKYATNSEEIEMLLKEQLQEVGDTLLDIEFIDYDKGVIYYTYSDMFDKIEDAEIDNGKYYFFTLEKI